MKQIFELREKFENESSTILENGEHNGSVIEDKGDKNASIRMPLLRLTGEVLMGNPDITTFWNIRREVLTEMKNKQG